MTFKLVPASSRYQQNADGTWTDMSEDEAFMTSAISAAEDLTVVGVICPNENGLHRGDQRGDRVSRRSD